MRSFTHIEPDTIQEVYTTLGNYHGKARLIAGGTELLLTLKADCLPEYPEAVINMKKIPGLDTIEEKGDTLRIGALAKLSDIAKSPLLLKMM
jgi:xanthine dehydrogenase YagS FAD-binding subunit